MRAERDPIRQDGVSYYQNRKRRLGADWFEPQHMGGNLPVTRTASISFSFLFLSFFLPLILQNEIAHPR